ncbi:hypothetical protein CRV15_16155 [Streptomyces clavuligerus]|uniref:Uncharacterized protein n=1 Tax=Streptomyces clavuligerus TaxID=1901 RepID=B5GPH5_STRCL|nr:hypothetical protein D1794_16800 [Streptomyces clavuligerus]EDY48221.1 hypothetical protein SSCG_01502 [Streptomyces clavuligerus]EFG07544.1 Hypothetical protein SCLAV_2471 [Streptomyces clavuligerus]QCS07016.1 hypothetical protein CRV15_16155 [Streptomyces clavuligerus]QPJ93627.1 hypothetical protein GE265_11880 [Streptomyces clavuligerus]
MVYTRSVKPDYKIANSRGPLTPAGVHRKMGVPKKLSTPGNKSYQCPLQPVINKIAHRTGREHWFNPEQHQSRGRPSITRTTIP